MCTCRAPNTLVLLDTCTRRKINQKNNNNGKGDDLIPYYNIYTNKSKTIHIYIIYIYMCVLEGRILD